MKSSRRDRDEDLTVLSSPDTMLQDDRQIADKSTTVIPVWNLPKFPPSWGAALEEVAAPISKAESEVACVGVDNRQVSKSPLPLRFCSLNPSHQPSQRIESISRKKVSWSDWGCRTSPSRQCRLATESVYNTKVIVVIQTVLNRSLEKTSLELCYPVCSGKSSIQMACRATFRQ